MYVDRDQWFTVSLKPHHHLASDVQAYGSFIISLDTRTMTHLDYGMCAVLV